MTAVPTVPSNSVVPSGGALATISALTLPPAPVLLSMTKVEAVEFGEDLRHDAGKQVGGAAGGEGHDDAHRLAGGIGSLRLAAAREHRRGESAGCNSDGKRGATADDLGHDAVSIDCGD